MIKYLQQRFALTEKGAKDLRKGIAFSTLMNLALMLPPTYLFFFLMEYIDAKPSTEPHALWFYVLVALLLAVLMFFIALRPTPPSTTRVRNAASEWQKSYADCPSLSSASATFPTSPLP